MKVGTEMFLIGCMNAKLTPTYNKGHGCYQWIISSVWPVFLFINTRHTSIR